jgi:hypothetical protein
MVSNALAVRRRIDWPTAAEWTTCIIEGDLEPIRDVFRKQGAQGPVVVWNPVARDVNAPPLAALLEYWTALRRGESLPAADKVDPLGMRRSLGYVMLVDVVEDGRDFRYRLFGSAVAAISGFDMTGRLLSEHAASTYLLEFSLALYRAAIQQRKAVFCHYSPAGTLRTAQWHRLALPLTDGSDNIIRLLVGTVPIGRDGRILSGRF